MVEDSNDTYLGFAADIDKGFKSGGIKVKLTDLVNSVRYRFREVENFIRYPLDNLYRIGRRTAEEKFEQIEVPLGKGDRPEDTTRSAYRNQEASPQEHRTRTSSYGGVHREPVKIGSASTGLQPQPTRKLANAARSLSEPSAKRRSQPRPVEIPPILSDKQEIRGGRRGRYRVESLLKDGERVRLYQGTQLLNSKPVVIKEYLLLDHDFNQREARERKEEFERLASLNLKNGGVQDFRVIGPWDAIAAQSERRCYLITEQIPNTSLTLREYLAQTGPMPPRQVRQVLNQVLQTLWFLHNQKLRLSTGEVQQGLAHGNLSLDSLAIVTNEQQSVSDEPQFYIYISDLALWEHLFDPPTAKTVNPSFAQDLIDLGYVSFYLLSGGTVHSVFGQPLDPKIEQHWPSTNDSAIEKFIERLMGLNGSFKSAEEARQELLRLPPQSQIEAAIATESDEQKVNGSRLSRLLLTALVLGFLMGFTWGVIGLLTRWLGDRPAPGLMSRSDDSSYGCCIKNVTDVPTGNFTYTAAESEKTWSYVLQSQSLVSYGKTLEDELRTRQMKLQLSYKPVSTIDDAIQAVKTKKAAFLITRLVGNFAESLQQNNLKTEPFAYEGIVVFVAFSDAQRSGSLPEALNGKITFEQLRQLYTGEIKNWKQLKGDKLPDLPVKLYMPRESEAVRLFEELVFKGNPQQLNKFRELLATGQIIQKETINTFGDVLNDFENNNTGAISFGLLSQVFGQCSVYPLAVGEKNREVQALVQDNGKPINPTTDLCNDKGSYRPNIQVFKNQKYQWAYPLAVVYHTSQTSVGEKFAKILTTDEGQRLLSEAGLVPLRQVKPNR